MKKLKLTISVILLTSLTSCTSREKFMLEEMREEHSDIIEYIQTIEERVKALENKVKGYFQDRSST